MRGIHNINTQRVLRGKKEKSGEDKRGAAASSKEEKRGLNKPVVMNAYVRRVGTLTKRRWKREKGPRPRWLIETVERRKGDIRS